MITLSNRFEEIFDTLYDSINNLLKFMIINLAITKADLAVMKIISIYHVILIEILNDFK